MNLQTLENGLKVLRPNWQVPNHVNSFISTRLGGVSPIPYASLNLGLHVKDDPVLVGRNREIISQCIPSEPIWLDQVHGVDIWTPIQTNRQSDGAVSSQPNQVLTIMTADCMPILFCDEQGDVLGACHAGWRGLSNGIIVKTIQEMLFIKRPDHQRDYLSRIQVYLGPTIGPVNFEVGEDVRSAFLTLKDTEDMLACFKKLPLEGKYLANLFQMARLLLNDFGIERVFSENICSYDRSDVFFSHRKEKLTGRFASFLWKTV
jgi:YfiH family protein